MKTGPNIVAVGGDPGGAEALAPVLTALVAGGAAVHACAYRQAPAVWAARGLAAETLADTTDDAACAEILRGHAADFLLTATSMNGVNLEQKFTAAARVLGVPSLAVLDFWTNYRGRFADADGALAFVPDRVAVMDTRARDAMLAEGFAPEQLVVTGQPAFDEVAEWRRAAPGDLRSTVRQAFGVAAAERLVVFASQPLSTLLGADVTAPGHPGYTERTVLPLLIAALETLAREIGLAMVLLVRPHPRETESDYAALSSDAIRIVVSTAWHRRAVALAADLVAGMNSAFLVEACQLGCATVSLQPGLRLAESLPTVGSGETRAVYAAEEIRPVVAELLGNPPPVRRELSATPRATENILTLIRSMLRQPTLHHAS